MSCPFKSNLIESVPSSSQSKDYNIDRFKHHSQKTSNDAKEILQKQEESKGTEVQQCPFFASSGGGACPLQNSSSTDPKLNGFSPGSLQVFLVDITDTRIPYNSRASFILDHMDGSSIKCRKDLLKRQTKLRALPSIMIHSLFHDDTFNQIRRKELSSVFFIGDDIKIEGNKLALEGKFNEALDKYEETLSFYMWLQFKNKREDPFAMVLDDDWELKYMSLDRGQGEELFDKNNCKFRFFMGIVNSVIVNILHNAATIYIQLYHFDEAQKCIDFTLSIAPDFYECYLKQSQIIYYNINNPIDNLLQHKSSIMKAKDLALQAKGITQSQMNEVSEMYDKYKGRCDAREEKEKDLTEKVLRGAKRWYEGKECGGAGGKAQDFDFGRARDEMELVEIMNQKYFVAVQYFRDCNKKSEGEYEKAVGEYQRFADVFYAMKEVYYFKLDEKDKDIQQAYPVDNEEFRQCVEVSKCKLTSDIFFKAQNLNLQLFLYALDIKQERDKKRKATPLDPTPKPHNPYFSLLHASFFIPFLLVLLLVYYKDNLFNFV